MPEPISPAPVRDYLPRYLPAYIANGVLGLRCPRIPFLGGVSMVNGFAGLDVRDGLEGFARTPFPLGADITLDGVRLSQATQSVTFREQRYDFSRAELTTVLDFRIGDATARLEIRQFCSHRLPTIALQEIRITVDRAADLIVSVGLDPTGVDGRAEYLERPSGKTTPEAPEGLLVWHSHGEVSSCGLAFRSELLGASDAVETRTQADEHGMVATQRAFRARAGRPYRVRQMSSLVPSLAHPHPADHAARLLALAMDRGWDRMRDDQRDAWAELWKARIEIDGADRRWQSICDASLFYLLTSVHPASVASTSLFGLAYWPNYHYYRGHVMWDIETFALPPLLLVEPESARSILDYRSRHLEAARLNARLAGWKGAMYPWESCPLHGEEVTPGASAPTKGHATLDVALAFASYVHATGDRDYLRRTAWPVIEAVAEWTESRVEQTRRGFEIRGITGPAEADPPRDNNAFVNMAAATLIREAIGFAEALGEEPRRLWRAIADGLVLPETSHGRQIPNYDDYRIDQLKAGTPEAAAGIFPVGYRVPRAVEEATFRYAVEEQAPRYVGTAMLSSFLPYYAVRAGMPREAAELLETGYGNFINEPFHETDEFSNTAPDQPRTGPMFANIGGFLTTLLYGYPGLRIGAGAPETWAERSVVMPAGWKAIHVERVWMRGEGRSLTAVAGAPSAIIDGKRLRRAS
jgi:Glycosyl hydrolase family 65 central catalytic domain/Glycosyl hydrolase family 65, N-terminal domain